jgi:hypothetical protein
MIASFDLMTWALAILFFYSFYKVKKHKGLACQKSEMYRSGGQSMIFFLSFGL